MLIVRGVLVLLVLYGAAHAQTVAGDRPVESVRADHGADRMGNDDGPEGVGLGLVFGWAGQKDGKSGWSARLDEEIYPVFTQHKLFGFVMGIEAWRSGADNWGFSFPLAFVGGVRVEPMRLAMGAGVDVMLVDQVDDDTGFGLYAPLAMAKLGFDIRGIQMGVDTRVNYRWQFGADDHTRWQLGMYVAYTGQPPKRARKKSMVQAAP